MEPVSAGVTLAGLYVSKEIMNKLLGPTADYIGEEMKGLVEKCNINLDNIFSKSVKKVGKDIDDGGVVNPRVLKGVVDEGRFCEEELVAEYFSGVLATARGDKVRDDREISTLAIVKNLSYYQIRFHYMCYMMFHDVFAGEKLSVLIDKDRDKMKIYIPYTVFVTGMDFDEDELREWNNILVHCMTGLHNAGLIGETYSYGSKTHISKQYSSAPDYGIVLKPSTLGSELFLSVFGMGRVQPNELLNKEIDFLCDVELDLSKGEYCRII